MYQINGQYTLKKLIQCYLSIVSQQNWNKKAPVLYQKNKNDTVRCRYNKVTDNFRKETKKESNRDLKYAIGKILKENWMD